MGTNAIRSVLITVGLILVGGLAYFLWQTVPGQKSQTQVVVPMPPEKLYPYLAEAQKLDLWLPFADRKDFARVNFFSPYSGKGAGLAYFDSDKKEKMGITVRRAAENRYVQYALILPHASRPTTLTAFLKPTSASQTLIQWQVVTPPARRIDHWLGRVTKSDLESHLSASGAALSALITGSLQEENYLKKIQFDSIFTETLPAGAYIGTNASSAAKPENFITSVQLNANKVRNFASTDLQLKPMEFGKVSVFLTSYSGRGMQVTYFAGVPVKEKISSSDQNFISEQKPGGPAWSKFFRGRMEAVPEVISELSRAVAKAGRKPREYQLIFIENPQKGKPLLLKITALSE